MKPILMTSLCIFLSVAIVAAGGAALFLVRSHLPTYKNALAEAPLPLDAEAPDASTAFYESYPWNLREECEGSVSDFPKEMREFLYEAAFQLCALQLPYVTERPAAEDAPIELGMTRDTWLYFLWNYPFHSEAGDGVINVVLTREEELVAYDIVFSDPALTPDAAQINESYDMLSVFAPQNLIELELFFSGQYSDMEYVYESEELVTSYGYPIDYRNPILSFYHRYSVFSKLYGTQSSTFCALVALQYGETAFSYSDGMLYLSYDFEGMEFVLKYDVANGRFLGMRSDFRDEYELDIYNRFSFPEHYFH